MKVIKEYDRFNERRYGNPWVAIVNNETAQIDFGKSVGGYTGGYRKGEAGQLYVVSPIDGAVYAYGQKDYRGNCSETCYVKFTEGEFLGVEKSKLIEALQESATRENKQVTMTVALTDEEDALGNSDNREVSVCFDNGDSIITMIFGGKDGSAKKEITLDELVSVYKKLS